MIDYQHLLNELTDGICRKNGLSPEEIRTLFFQTGVYRKREGREITDCPAKCIRCEPPCYVTTADARDIMEGVTEC